MFTYQKTEVQVHAVSICVTCVRCKSSQAVADFLDKIPFQSYFSIKDMFGFIIIIIICSKLALREPLPQVNVEQIPFLNRIKTSWGESFGNWINK